MIDLWWTIEGWTMRLRVMSPVPYGNSGGVVELYQVKSQTQNAIPLIRYDHSRSCTTRRDNLFCNYSACVSSCCRVAVLGSTNFIMSSHAVTNLQSAIGFCLRYRDMYMRLFRGRFMLIRKPPAARLLITANDSIGIPVVPLFRCVPFVTTASTTGS